MVAVDTRSVLIAAGLIAIAFLPSVIYVVWVRNLERHGREPWKRVVKAFLWGAIGGVVLTVVLTMFLPWRPDAIPALGITPTVIAAVVVAPLVEEFAKAVGLGFVDDKDVEPEDGIVYGAAAGFGFAATENLLYEFNALVTVGVAGFLLTVLIRSVSSALLHGSASALVGLGIWRRRAGIGGFLGIVGLYLAAVLLHALFNLAASLQILAGLIFAIALALWVFAWLRKHTRHLDRASKLAQG